MNYTKEQIRVGAEKAFILDLIVNRFPKGIVSYVADSFNLWDVITKILPTIKSEIMARDGKLVIRPDSGDPVNIICGYNWSLKTIDQFSGAINNPAYKGVIELLWGIFGGTINDQGYKVLDPHIGAIYGDSITPDRQRQIYERLAAKGFAATNIVLGIGSYSYGMNSRDSLGFAAKGSWFEVETTEVQNVLDKEGYKLDDVTVKKSYNIYKDPITDDGTKQSLKGLLQVYEISNPHIPIEENGYFVKTECTPEQENEGLLQVIYEDGKFYNQTTLNEVRERLKQI